MTSSSARPSRPTTLADGRVGLSAVDGFSSGAADDLRTALEEQLDGGRPGHRPRPARRPGRLRGRSARDRQPVRGRRADLLGGVRRRRDHPPSRRSMAAWRPTRHPGRGARQRRHRVGERDRGRGARRTPDARRSWARRPSARAPSSSGTSCRATAGGFRLSVAKWLTPDKTWVHGVGITPTSPSSRGRRTEPTPSSSGRSAIRARRPSTATPSPSARIGAVGLASGRARHRRRSARRPRPDRRRGAIHADRPLHDVHDRAIVHGNERR